MKITDRAKEAIEEMSKLYGVHGIRLYSMGAGCCGPELGLALERPFEHDIIKIINTVQVAIDPRVIAAAEKVTLDKQDEGFVLLGLNEGEYNCQ